MDTKKLRQKILDLAIRGKLVPQDPNDEPASVLLERIRAEKEQLIKEGKIKRTKKSNASDTSHYENYALPTGWQYARMGEICSKIVDGDHNPPSAQSTPTKYLMVSSRNIANDKICNITDVRYLTEHDFYCAHNRTFVEKGDILFTSVASLGRTCIYNLEGPVTFQRSVTVIKTHIYNKYLKLFLDSPIYQNYVNDNARGTAQKGFYINQISDSWVPIPPLAEQIRIATKAEELINTVCQLEILKDDLGNNIEKAKSIILDMAIMGRLTPHDPFDEPAIELLKRISPNFSSCDNRHYENIQINIPNTWCWGKVGDLFEHNTGKALNSSNTNGSMLNYITTSNLYWDRFDLTIVKQMRFTDSEIEKCKATKGDLLLCEGGDVGRAAIWNYDFDIMIQNHIHRLRGKVDVSSRFFFYVFMLYKQKNYIGGKGVAIQGLSSRDLHNLPIPIPPLKEQYRIADTLDNLIAKMDKITAEL